MDKQFAGNDAELFNSLGFEWDRSAIPQSVPVHDVRRACFRLQNMLAQYVFDASYLEGNPFTYPQVKTILDGIRIDAISIPASRAQEFNEKMVDFYVNRNGTAMMAFLVNCHPDANSLG
jgi:hypothetical protein